MYRPGRTGRSVAGCPSRRARYLLAAGMSGREISVGRRLVGLIVIEVICGGSLLALLLWWVSSTSHHIRVMDRYALEPIAGTTSALETGAQLKYVTEASPPDATARVHALTVKLEAFVDRYQAVWVVADNPSEG